MDDLSPIHAAGDLSDPPGPASPRQDRVAVVDDEPSMRRLIGRMLSLAGFQVDTFEGGAAALAGIDRATSVVCLDLGLDDIPGVEVLKVLRLRMPDVPVVVVTARTKVDEVVAVMKAGAYDYVAKPFDELRFHQTVRRAAEYRAMLGQVRRLEDALGAKTLIETLAGNSVAMREVVSSVERVRNADVSVAIMGESGTGKEVVARAIHEGGPTRHGAFVAVNCASIPHSIQESELFGHEKGAFTGAVATHQGKFEQASGGTLFLDEVGEMAPATQASLLRVVQERVIVRVGGRSEIPVDARVICATHRDLAAEVRAGRFREDLYFRLVVYPIRLPPLRDRGDDLPLLVAQLLQRSRIGRDRGIRAVSPEALAVLGAYGWPGNIRELDNVIQRACLACDGTELQVHHLPAEIRAPSSRRASPSSPPSAVAGAAAWSPSARAVATFTGPAPGTEHTLRAIETGAVRAALTACGGNVTKAAKLLGVSRTKLYRDMKKG